MTLPVTPAEHPAQLSVSHANLTRRRFLLGVGALGATALSLAACGGATTTPAASTAPSAAPSGAPSAAGAASSAAPSAATARATTAASSGGTATAGGAATATRAGGTPIAGGLRLVPLDPAALGAPVVPEPTKSTAANAVPYGPAVAAYDAYGTDAAPGVFPRTIRHATGTVQLAKKPERVLPLDSGELDSVVQLGLKPVGYLVERNHPDYLRTILEGLPTVGTLAEPKLETIASIRPDLMLTSKIRHEKLNAQLQTIAPTVFGDRTGVVWKQNFALHARALGREVEADATVRAYEDRIRKINAVLPNPRPSISVVRVLDNHLRYYQRANYSGTVLNDMGFRRPDSQNVDDFALLNQSLETLGSLGDADHIVVTFTQGENGEFSKQFLASPLWQNLGAVRRGNFFVGSDDIWMAGIGYRSAGTILDDIARYFRI